MHSRLFNRDTIVQALTLLAVAVPAMTSRAQAPEVVEHFRLIPRLSVLHQTGGFAGVETIASVNDFVREAIEFYPKLSESLMLVSWSPIAPAKFDMLRRGR